MYLLLIYCHARQRELLLDEFHDWQSEGAMILLSGITNKAYQGFIFLGWNKPVPENFRQKMKEDPDILDYIAFGAPVPPGSILQST